jgi:two-component system NarL family sensor kinase
MSRVRTWAGRLRPARWAICAAAVVLALSGTWLALRIALPGDAAPWLQDPGFKGGITLDGKASSDVPRLQAHDVVVAVNGEPLDHWLGHSAPARPVLAAGTALTYRVHRNGVVRDIGVILAREPVAERLRGQGGVLGGAFALLALGGFVITRRPDHPAAQALLLFGAAFTAYNLFVAVEWEAADVVAAPAMFVLGMAGWIVCLTVFATAVAHLALTFPSPPALLHRRPWLVGVLYGVALAVNVGVIVYLLVGRATIAGLQRWYDLSSMILTAMGLLAIAAIVRIGWHAWRDRLVRRQVRLVGLGLAVTVIGLMTLTTFWTDQRAPQWVIALLFLPVPAAVATAILRGEFLDIRATINRALVFASVTIMLAGVYGAVVAIVGVIAGDTGIVASLPATAVVALVFAPVAARSQRAVERLLYGDRGRPAHVLGALSSRLEAAIPPDDVLPVIAETIASALRLPYVGITTAASGGNVVCERGERPATVEEVLLVHQGEPVGELLVGRRSGERSLGAVDRALIADIARHVAGTVQATTLLTDLASSRSRLAVAREEERARLRHDLHDRLGSRLVGLALHLDTTANDPDATPVADALHHACDETDAALNEVRRLTRGLRPADLDELGLVAAVEAAANRLTVGECEAAWRTDVAAAVHLPSLAPDVEAAAYQIALEAMTNAYRHSGGSHAQVRIAVDSSGTTLVIEIADDGTGPPETDTAGIGLASMRERAAAVGGCLIIRPSAEGGTLVRAELPVA